MTAQRLRASDAGEPMASLTHALLTEDESILLDALPPAPGDRILALFARGNGDAALSLLRAGPSNVYLFDLFDPQSLRAQFQLKLWLFRRLDNPALRAFLGIADGFDAAQRDSILRDALRDLPADCRAFWHARRHCVRNGMARRDGTATWCHMLRRSVRAYRRLPPPLRAGMLRISRVLAPLYFPREERQHSLGYRQLMANPDEVFSSFIGPRDADDFRNLIPYAEFQYLSAPGHEAVARNLDRAELLGELPPPEPCNKIYFSNVVDYLSAEDFHALLGRAIPAGGRPWRGFLNSSFAASRVHPHLQRAIDEGMFRVDEARTGRLRAMDRVRAYPGLTVIRSDA
ncbi:MAG: hypothetical protein L6Q92_16845 [Phycisphaerae bacterium]|nr:hypothetical protein [Phycisphaerae bacterium]